MAMNHRPRGAGVQNPFRRDTRPRGGYIPTHYGSSGGYRSAHHHGQSSMASRLRHAVCFLVLGVIVWVTFLGGDSSNSDSSAGSSSRSSLMEMETATNQNDFMQPVDRMSSNGGGLRAASTTISTTSDGRSDTESSYKLVNEYSRDNNNNINNHQNTILGRKQAPVSKSRPPENYGQSNSRQQEQPLYSAGGSRNGPVSDVGNSRNDDDRRNSRNSQQQEEKESELPPMQEIASEDEEQHMLSKKELGQSRNPDTQEEQEQEGSQGAAESEDTETQQHQPQSKLADSTEETEHESAKDNVESTEEQENNEKSAANPDVTEETQNNDKSAANLESMEEPPEEPKPKSATNNLDSTEEVPQDVKKSADKVDSTEETPNDNESANDKGGSMEDKPDDGKSAANADSTEEQPQTTRSETIVDSTENHEKSETTTNNNPGGVKAANHDDLTEEKHQEPGGTDNDQDKEEDESTTAQSKQEEAKNSKADAVEVDHNHQLPPGMEDRSKMDTPIDQEASVQVNNEASINSTGANATSVMAFTSTVLKSNSSTKALLAAIVNTTLDTDGSGVLAAANKTSDMQSDVAVKEIASDAKLADVVLPPEHDEKEKNDKADKSLEVVDKSFELVDTSVEVVTKEDKAEEKKSEETIVANNDEANKKADKERGNEGKLHGAPSKEEMDTQSQAGNQENKKFGEPEKTEAMDGKHPSDTSSSQGEAKQNEDKKAVEVPKEGEEGASNSEKVELADENFLPLEKGSSSVNDNTPPKEKEEFVAGEVDKLEPLHSKESGEQIEAHGDEVGKETGHEIIDLDAGDNPKKGSSGDLTKAESEKDEITAQTSSIKDAPVEPGTTPADEILGAETQ